MGNLSFDHPVPIGKGVGGATTHNEQDSFDSGSFFMHQCSFLHRQRHECRLSGVNLLLIVADSFLQVLNYNHLIVLANLKRSHH